MKIVSLQSVGLGTYFETPEFGITYSPTIYKVGERLYEVGFYSTGQEPLITKIESAPAGTGDEIIYKIYTSDGHIRVLPADKYIAEWSDDTDRISPDDIGNDIHEFLHGGDK